MTPPGPRDWTRREALGAGLAAVAALGLRAEARAARPAWTPRLGLQSYSLRGYTKGGKPDLDKALQVTHDLGLSYWESYVAHIPISSDAAQVAAYADRAKAAGVAVVGYGVIHFSKDEAASRKVFEFAKLMNLGYVSADPDPDAFDSLDKLVEEYRIPIGIHNHGPGHRYGPIDTIAKAIKDHSPLIGCCVDTGHFLRSKEDPVRAVEVFGKRTYGVHLKDVKNADTFTVLGEGDLRTAALFQALAASGYDKCVAIEYEEHPDDPFAEIKRCVAVANKIAAGEG